MAEGPGPGNVMTGLVWRFRHQWEHRFFRHALAAVSGIVPVLRRGGGVIEFSGQRWARLAAVGALAVALGLSACGRKGPLDPPPSAQHSAQSEPTGPVVLGTPGPQPGIGVGSDGKAAAPPPTGKDNRPFILDWLVE